MISIVQPNNLQAIYGDTPHTLLVLMACGAITILGTVVRSTQGLARADSRCARTHDTSDCACGTHRCRRNLPTTPFEAQCEFRHTLVGADSGSGTPPQTNAELRPRIMSGRCSHVGSSPCRHNRPRRVGRVRVGNWHNANGCASSSAPGGCERGRRVRGNRTMPPAA